MLKSNDSEVRDWKSENMVPCSFCIATRRPDPNYVIVSLASGNDTVAICETCVKGAVCAVTREYARIANRNPPKPDKHRARRTAKQ